MRGKGEQLGEIGISSEKASAQLHKAVVARVEETLKKFQNNFRKDGFWEFDREFEGQN